MYSNNVWIQKLAIAENKRTLPKKKSTEIINVYNLFIYQINIIQTIPRYINMFNYFNSVKNEKGLCRLEKQMQNSHFNKYISFFGVI